MTAITYPFAIPANLNQWAADVEAIGGYPVSDTPALIAWGQAEGGSFNNPDYGNVLGTTRNTDAQGNALGGVPTNGPGVLDFSAGGTVDQATAWQHGLESTIAMLNQSNMSDINSALQSGDPTQLPPALNADPWGTAGPSVATILGENPDTIAALGAAGGTPTSGGSGIILTSGGGSTPINQTGLTSALGGTALNFLGLKSGEHIMVRAVFAIVGIILVTIALKEMFTSNSAIDTVVTLPSQTYQTAKSGAKRTAKVGTDAAAAAGVAAA